MYKYHSGDKVKGGFYWDMRKWEIAAVSGKEGVLPGTEAHRYMRVPTLFCLVLAPVMGLLYVIFLPLIGFVFVLGLAGAKAGRVLRASASPALARFMALSGTKAASTPEEPQIWAERLPQSTDADD